MRTIILFLSFVASSAFASVNGGSVSHTPASDGTQWTLADWLLEKNKLRLQDQFLALHHTTKYFDLNLSADAQQYTLKTTSATTGASNSVSGADYRADMYLSILNINLEYQKDNNNQESYGGALGLRLLGTGSKTTNLVARYGWRRLDDLTKQERWDNQYVEGNLQLYLVKNFGLDGEYRYYFPSTSNLGDGLQGFRVTAGAFIEVGLVRIEGSYFQEPLKLSSGGVVTTQQSEGFQGGLKLLF